MLALTMDETQVRGFMNRLLKDEIFDAFEVRSVEINALTRVGISGELEGDTRAFAVWAQIKPLATTVIKNHQMPRHMKIILSAGNETASNIHANAAALFLNIVYENGAIFISTGSSQKQFSMDKSLDEKWDEYVNLFFSKNGIPVKIKE